WYIRTTGGGVVAWGLPWGGPELTPVSGDYDGDGVSDLAVYNQQTGTWYIRSVSGTLIGWGLSWGGTGFMSLSR
ncbi:MAG: hypothetical protein HY343_04355, partial [Lentisphaerae bacterium]|nr:hypothetical protein [Lentisphaerota bacterium]